MSRAIRDLPSSNPGPGEDRLRDYYLELGESPKSKTTMQTWRRFDRAVNRSERSRFRARRMPLPSPTYIWLVTLTAIDVPAWAREKAVKDFDAQLREVWMRARRHANQLMQEDSAAGGRPWTQKKEARRCKVCGWLLLGVQAEIRREFEKEAPDNRFKPCSADCLQRKELKRG
jgi:hypothetical protein